jgi:hypothetical protein
MYKRYSILILTTVAVAVPGSCMLQAYNTVRMERMNNQIEADMKQLQKKMISDRRRLFEQYNNRP